MSLDADLAARAVPHGSMLHYSLLFAPETQRHALLVVHAFRTHTLDIAQATREAHVAELRIGWWREELDRIESAAPRHPLGQEVAAVLSRFDLDPAPLRDMLRAADGELAGTPITSWEALGEYCRLGAGAAQRLSAAILAGMADKRDALATFGGRLGEALRLTEILRDVREDANFGRIYLPLEELDKRGLTVASFGEGSNPERQSLFLEAHDRAATMFDGLTETLREGEYAAQTPGLILAALHVALLEKMRRDDFGPGENKPRLSPAWKLWTAWRTARRAARGKGALV